MIVLIVLSIMFISLSILGIYLAYKKGKKQGCDSDYCSSTGYSCQPAGPTGCKPDSYICPSDCPNSGCPTGTKCMDTTKDYCPNGGSCKGDCPTNTCPTGQSCKGDCPACPTNTCPTGQSCQAPCATCPTCPACPPACTGRCINPTTDDYCHLPNESCSEPCPIPSISKVTQVEFLGSTNKNNIPSGVFTDCYLNVIILDSDESVKLLWYNGVVNNTTVTTDQLFVFNNIGTADMVNRLDSEPNNDIKAVFNKYNLTTSKSYQVLFNTCNLNQVNATLTISPNGVFTIVVEAVDGEAICTPLPNGLCVDVAIGSWTCARTYGQQSNGLFQSGVDLK